MYVRLAFAVAAHMEPDILIVDEVLAVGDAEFQKKCLGKMEEVTKKDGRTVLFVSHNLMSIQKLCKKTILLEKGKIKKMGNTKEVLDYYINNKENLGSVSSSKLHLRDEGNFGDIRFIDMKISDKDGSSLIKSDSKLKFILKYKSNFTDSIKDVRVVLSIESERSKQIVLRLDSDVTSHTLSNALPPYGEIACETGEINLSEGSYFVHIDFLTEGTSCDYVKMAGEFNVAVNNKKYGYKIDPDKTVCDYVLEYSFKQK